MMDPSTRSYRPQSPDLSSYTPQSPDLSGLGYSNTTANAAANNNNQINNHLLHYHSTSITNSSPHDPTRHQFVGVNSEIDAGRFAAVQPLTYPDPAFGDQIPTTPHHSHPSSFTASQSSAYATQLPGHSLTSRTSYHSGMDDTGEYRPMGPATRSRRGHQPIQPQQAAHPPPPAPAPPQQQQMMPPRSQPQFLHHFPSQPNHLHHHHPQYQTQTQTPQSSHHQLHRQAYNGHTSFPQLSPLDAVMPDVAPATTIDPTYGVQLKTSFPVARIKRIMQADEDIGKVAQVTPHVVSRALELFMIKLITASASQAQGAAAGTGGKGQRRILAQHLKRVIMTDDNFDFLREIVNRVPDAASKTKKEAASDSDEAKPAKKKGKKRKDSSDDF